MHQKITSALYVEAEDRGLVAVERPDDVAVKNWYPQGVPMFFILFLI